MCWQTQCHNNEDIIPWNNLLAYAGGWPLSDILVIYWFIPCSDASELWHCQYCYFLVPDTLRLIHCTRWLEAHIIAIGQFVLKSDFLSESRLFIFTCSILNFTSWLVIFTWSIVSDMFRLYSLSWTKRVIKSVPPCDIRFRVVQKFCFFNIWTCWLCFDLSENNLYPWLCSRTINAICAIQITM